MDIDVQQKLMSRPGATTKRRSSRLRFGVRTRLSARADQLIGVAGIVTVVILWCILSYGGFVRQSFLPTPTGIWRGLLEFHQKGFLFPAIGRSFLRVMASMLLVFIIGVPIGVLMGAYTPVDAFLRKLVNGAKAVPTTGLTGLIVLWFAIEEKAKIVFLFLGAIFYMIILVKNAVANVSEDYERVALDLGASRWQVIRRVLLPGAWPHIWDALAVCNGIMWTYIVLAEFINSNAANLGVGYLLYIGSHANSSGQVFGILIVIAIICSATDFALVFVRRKWFNW